MNKPLVASATTVAERIRALRNQLTPAELIAEVARKIGAPARARLAEFERMQIDEEKARGAATS